MRIDKNIGEVYGCYKILGIGEPSVLPSGQKKKNYICECVKCHNIRQVNAYKVTHNNYQYCNNCTSRQHKLRKSLIGQKFGRLTVIARADNHVLPSGQTKVMYKCICDCGNEIIVESSHLQSGHATSCGCYRIEVIQEMLIKDLTGQKFGKLTVVNKNEIKHGRQYWNCICDCGKSVVASTTSLVTGKRKSCGCLNSVAEHEFAIYLDKSGYLYEPQFTFEDCKDKRKLPFDFGIKNDYGQVIMLVELHGQQHYAPFTYCNEPKETKIENYIDRKNKDMIKENYCKQNNIPLLVIKYNEFNKKEEIFERFYDLTFNKEGDCV